MKHQILLALTLSILFLNYGFHAYAIKIEIQNNCHHLVWPAILTTRGNPITPNGFKLDYRQLVSLEVSDNWSGRIYPRTFCSTTGAGGNQRFHCDVGDCGTGNIRCDGKVPRPPLSVVEISMAPRNGRKNYFIDLKDGLNVPVSVTPFDNSCKRIFCLKDLKVGCPNWLAVYDHQGAKIACKSACLATDDTKDCCRGSFAAFGKCPLNQYSYFVENACSSTVVHAFSPRKYTCFGGIGYRVNFC